MRARYSGPCASHHLGAVRGNPGIVGMLSELGNKVFRHVGLPPEHDFQCGCPLLRRCGCFSFFSVMGSNSVGYARRATGLDAPSTLLLANVLDCLLGKGGLM